LPLRQIACLELGKAGSDSFPVWQFIENRRLPVLEAVLEKLAAGSILDDWGKIDFS
jgi:hypothetical protein